MLRKETKETVCCISKGKRKSGEQIYVSHMCGKKTKWGIRLDSGKIVARMKNTETCLATVRYLPNYKWEIWELADGGVVSGEDAVRDVGLDEEEEETVRYVCMNVCLRQKKTVPVVRSLKESCKLFINVCVTYVWRREDMWKVWGETTS